MNFFAMVTQWGLNAIINILLGLLLNSYKWHRGPSFAFNFFSSLQHEDKSIVHSISSAFTGVPMPENVEKNLTHKFKGKLKVV